MTLTPGQVEAYRNDGYVVVRSALPKRSVFQLREAADSFAEQALRLSGDTDAIELDDAAALAGGPARIRRIKSPHLHHDAFAAMLAHPPLLDMVEALIGPDIRWHHTKLNAKQPCGSGHVEWHTDWGYYPHTNDDLLEISIALDRSTEDSGCLRVVPGSHRGPVLDHTQREAVAPTRARSKPRTDAGGILSRGLEAGRGRGGQGWPNVETLSTRHSNSTRRSSRDGSRRP